jgi:hypothetical protein
VQRGRQRLGLAAGNCLLRKDDKNPALKVSYEGAFALD